MTDARNLPVLNVGVIGHAGDGKTTLTVALTRRLSQRPGCKARAYTFDELVPLRTYGPYARETSLHTAYVDYDSTRRRYNHIDVPGLRRRLARMVRSSSMLDAAVLVVSAPDAVRAQTREHVALVPALDAQRLVVFLNKCDLVKDAEWLDAVETETREMLFHYGIDGDAVPVIRGAARPASEGDARWEPLIDALLDTLDQDVPDPARVLEGPFVMPVEKVYYKGQDVIVAGRVERGEVAIQDALELHGRKPTPLPQGKSWPDVSLIRRGKREWGYWGSFAQPVRVGSIERFRLSTSRAQAGDQVGILLRELGGMSVQPGMVLATRDAVKLGRRFRCTLRVIPREHGGRHTPVRDGHRGHFFLGTDGVTGALILREDKPLLMPGDTTENVLVELMRPAWIEPGMRFSVRDGTDGLRRGGPEPVWGGTALTGEITKVEA